MSNLTPSNLYQDAPGKMKSTLMLIGVILVLSVVLAVLVYVAYVIFKFPRYLATIYSTATLAFITTVVTHFVSPVRALVRNLLYPLWQNSHRTTVTFASIAVSTACLVTVFPLFHTIFDPYTGRGFPALQDNLQHTAQGSYQWETNTTYCQLTDEGYDVTADQPNTFEDCIAESPQYQNFVFEAQMIINKAGNCGGLFFRDHPNRSTSYFLRICSDGYYQILRYNSGSGYDSYAASCTKTQIDCSIIEGYYGQPSHSYLLAIEADKSTLTVYVNHESLQSQDDATNTEEGHIGFIANDDTTPTTVTFKNAKLWLL